MDGAQEVVALVAWLFQAAEQGREWELYVVEVGQGMVDWICARAEWEDSGYAVLSVLDTFMESDRWY